MKKENRTANFYDVIRERRSVRFYDPSVKIDEEEINNCLKRLFSHMRYECFYSVEC